MKSDTIGKLALALSKAQGAMQPAAFDKVNPAFKNKYASLAATWEAARGPLSANELAVIQALSTTAEGETILVSTLVHSSGEFCESIYPVRPTQDTPQAFGSALTYAMKFSLRALIGASSDDGDDDGNAAAVQGKPQPAQQQRQAPAVKQTSYRDEPGPQITQQAPAGWTPPANGHEAEPTPDEVFDAMPSASENAKTPHATEAQKKPMHWSQDKVLMGQWWGWVKKPMGLDETDVHMLAEVEHLIDYPGTKEELSMLVREESKRRAMQRQSMAGLQGKKELA